MTEVSPPAFDGQRALHSPKISFEFFPPKTEDGARNLSAARFFTFPSGRLGGRPWCKSWSAWRAWWDWRVGINN